jgi:hypothetical protein
MTTLVHELERRQVCAPIRSVAMQLARACFLRISWRPTSSRRVAALAHSVRAAVSQGRYGMLAICEGGGTANATIIERVGDIKAKL